MPITPETKLVRDGDILHAPVGADEAVMMSIEAGRYYGLNAVASRIWELLESSEDCRSSSARNSAKSSKSMNRPAKPRC